MKTQESKTIVDGSGTYKTTDLNMIKALMSLGHSPSGIQGEGGTVTFFFNEENIHGDLSKLLTNQPVLVSIHAVWAADKTWQMVYHQYKNG